MIPRSKLGLKFFPQCFRRHVYLQDLSIVVMRDILQSRYLRRRVAHKQLARTSLTETIMARAKTLQGHCFSLCTCYVLMIVFQISDILVATVLILLSKANILSCKSSNSKSIVTTLDARWHSSPLLLEARLVEIITMIIKFSTSDNAFCVL